MHSQDIENRGKDTLAERRDEVQAKEPWEKWAFILLATIVVLFAFAHFVMPLNG